jgi:hypothetical protein
MISPTNLGKSPVLSAGVFLGSLQILIRTAPLIITYFQGVDSPTTLFHPRHFAPQFRHPTKRGFLKQNFPISGFRSFFSPLLHLLDLHSETLGDWAQVRWLRSKRLRSFCSSGQPDIFNVVLYNPHGQRHSFFVLS